MTQRVSGAGEGGIFFLQSLVPDLGRTCRVKQSAQACVQMCLGICVDMCLRHEHGQIYRRMIRYAYRQPLNEVSCWSFLFKISRPTWQVPAIHACMPACTQVHKCACARQPRKHEHMHATRPLPARTHTLVIMCVCHYNTCTHGASKQLRACMYASSEHTRSTASAFCVYLSRK